jgi:hypothetical protein
VTHLDQPANADAIVTPFDGGRRAVRSGPQPGRHAQIETDFTGRRGDEPTRTRSAHTPEADTVGVRCCTRSPVVLSMSANRPPSQAGAH